MKKTEQSLTWSDVWTSWVKRGFPYEEAAFRADEFMRKRERERSLPRPQFVQSRLAKTAPRKGGKP